MANNTLIISGCDLLKIVYKAGLCRTGKDNEKAADIIKIMAESKSAYEKANVPQPQADPATGKAEPAEKESFLKHLYNDLAMQSNRIISTTKYDFCKPNVTPLPNTSGGSQECGTEAGYEIRTSWWGLLTKDVVPLCEGISSILSTAVRPSHLSACLTLAFYDQKEKLQDKGEVVSVENDANFTISAAQCLNTVEISKSDDGNMNINMAADSILHPVTGKPMEQIVDLEWLCGNAMLAILTQEDLADMNAGKKPEGMQNLEKCFETELGGVKWNTLVEADKMCMEAEDGEPWAYGFATVGGGAAIVGVAALLRVSGSIFAYAFSYVTAAWGVKWLEGKRAFFDKVAKRDARRGGGNKGSGEGAAPGGDAKETAAPTPIKPPIPPADQAFEWVYPTAVAAAAASVYLAREAAKKIPGWPKVVGAVAMAGGAVIIGEKIDVNDIISDILCGVVGCGEAK
ncbi:MAG: hypothetical protein HYY43_06455 [Deltaproteobacteria bacterium]|nr:hypothetical protein [Deltaproteobacteria bacterium]MBI2342082.1 hypothetical protein [Deltaproteobacteria bacterium]MBI2975212.1 hypothetical protein [Deltaproteobacteria bacterium]